MSPGTSEISEDVKRTRGRPPLNPQTRDKVDDLIDTMSKFESHILKASMSGQPYLEVAPEVFDYYTHGQDTPYFTYGPKGIKVYKVGTREDCESRDSMRCDEAVKFEHERSKK